MMKSLPARCAAAFLALGLVTMDAAPLVAQTDPAPADALVVLDVLPGWTTDRGTRMAGLRLRLAPGWKTYWRAPGDAGIPPLLDLGESSNISTMSINWPVPEVFDTAGMRSIGYHDQVMLPVEITPHGPGAIHLAGTLDIGICEEICMPARLSFDALLPEGGARNGQIVAALLDRPMTEAEAGIGAVRCTLTPGDHGLTINVTADVPPFGADEEMVIEAGDAEVWVSEPELARSGATLSARAKMVHVDGGAFAVDRSAVRITVLAGGQAVDIRGCTAE